MQIKVKDTRMHKTRESYTIPTSKGKQLITEDNDLLVAEAKLILLEVSENITQVGLCLSNMRLYKPILISETEKIEVGDWYLVKRPDGYIDTAKCDKVSDTQVMYFEEGNPNITIYTEKEFAFKILALPEHFSSKHLQAIVDGKLKDGDKVLVECEYIQTEVGNAEGWEDAIDGVWCGHVIKLNCANHVTLHKLEEIVLPLSKVKTLCERAFHGMIKLPGDTTSFTTWWEEHKEWFK